MRTGMPVSSDFSQKKFNQKVISVVLAGIGGQGVSLLSDILAYSCFLSGFDVKKSEIKGVAQRNGLIRSDIRYGKKIYSPVVSAAEADVLVLFEMSFAESFIHLLKKGGTVICNECSLKNITVPKDYVSRIKRRIAVQGGDLLLIKKEQIGLFSSRGESLNIFLLGILTNVLHFSAGTQELSIKKFLSQKKLKANLSAFNSGLQYPLTNTCIKSP